MFSLITNKEDIATISKDNAIVVSNNNPFAPLQQLKRLFTIYKSFSFYKCSRKR
jgi:hypothetical protein